MTYSIKERIVKAPRFLLLLCALPVLLFAVAVAFNVNLFNFFLLVWSLLMAGTALYPGKIPKYVFMAWMAVIVSLSLLLIDTFRHALSGPPGWDEFSNIYFTQALVLVGISSILVPLYLGGIVYFFKSRKVGLFYQLDQGN